MTGELDLKARWGFDWAERERVLELEFPIAEYETRLAKVRQQLVKHELEALIVYGSPASKANVRYLSGWESFFGESFLLVSLDRAPILITNSIFHGEPMHSNIQATWVRDFRPSMAFGTVLKMRSLADQVGDALRDWGVLGKRIGYIDARKISAAADRELRLALSDTALVEDGSILTEVRAIKSPAEIAVIRTLAQAASLGMADALAAAVPGNTEHDISAAFTYRILKEGCETCGFGSRIQAGKRSAMKNVLPLRGKRIQPGELISIDTAAELYGYQSDHARSLVAGEPTADQVRLLEACVAAQEEGFRATGPGKRIADMMAIMHDVVRDYGFQDWDWCVGHGFGLDLVELPFIVSESDLCFEAGQTFFLEPMIVPTEIGTSCFEDTILVTEDGAERLTTTPLRTW